MLKAIIFDMDGVLFDSPKYVWKSFNKILEKYDVHVDEEKQKKYMGRSLRDQIALIKQDFGIEAEFDIEQLSEKMNKIQLELMGGSIAPNQQILSLIQQARQEKIKVAVATSSTRKRAEELLEMVEVKDKLDQLVTVEDVEKHKPSPDIYLKAADKLKVEPENCVIFEDAPHGIKAGKRAEMKVVGLETDYHSGKELAEADLVIPNFSQIKFTDLKQLTG